MTTALVVLVLFGGFAAWVYHRLEFAAPGRSFLLAARLAALATAAAIVWNPSIPDWGARGAASRYVILDASLSMTAKGEDGAVLWDGAVARAEALAAEGARVLLAGHGVRGAAASSLRSSPAEDVESRLAPAFSAAAEAGARDVALLSDLRLQDPMALAAAARRLGVGLSVDTAWGPRRAAANLGLSRLVLPATAAGSSPLEGRLEVEGDWGADSVSVSVSVDGAARHLLRLGGEPGWGIQAADFAISPPLEPGPRRVSARILPARSADSASAAPGIAGDAFPLDDHRSAVVRIDPEEAGIVLVALAPSWEARFLLPVLEQVTGLPVRGFLRVGPDRFIPMLSGGRAAGTASQTGDMARVGAGSWGGGETGDGAAASDLARLARRAGLVVALGVDASNHNLLGDALAEARRLLVLARDPEGAALGSVEASAALQGEWYVEAAPPSPLAGDLAGLSWQGLPPLSGLLAAPERAGRGSLGVRRRDGAETLPAILLHQDGDLRRATVLADGFWRWAARDGQSREAYRRLWAAVAGWTAAGEPPSAGSSAYERQPSSSSGTTEDVLEVEQFTDEMLRPAVDPAMLSAPPPGGRSSAPARPLRTSPLPYLLILAVLCAEWVGRRRAGLR